MTEPLTACGIGTAIGIAFAVALAGPAPQLAACGAPLAVAPHADEGKAPGDAASDPKPSAPTCREQIGHLAHACPEAPIDREWEAKAQAALAALASCSKTTLEEIAGDEATSALERAIALIAIDRAAHPERHAALDRYRHSHAEEVRREGHTVGTAESVNMPPPLRPKHAQPEYRQAWEGMLLSAGWWQGAERAIGALRAMGPADSAPALSTTLLRAMRGFDRSDDAGWRERVILELITVLGGMPDRAVLVEFAEAAAAAPYEDLRERMRLVIMRNDAWAPIIAAAREDPEMAPHRAFLESLR